MLHCRVLGLDGTPWFRKVLGAQGEPWKGTEVGPL